MNTYQKIIIVVGVVAVASVVWYMYTMGTLPLSLAGLQGKPEKPEIPGIVNPDIIERFDMLYDKYPDITQTDVDLAFNELSAKCLVYDIPASSQESENAMNSPLGQMMKASFCKGMMHGLIQNYLQDLHIPVYTTTESTLAPELIN